MEKLINPCTKDCPRRTPTCRRECPEHREYEEAKFAEYHRKDEERKKAEMLYRYTKSNIKSRNMK